MGTITELGIAVHDLAETISDWSQRTFGTDAERGPIGPLKHLEKEAREAQAKPDDPMEHADCLILVLDASRRAGVSLASLLKHAQDKMKANRARAWPDPKAGWTFGKPIFIASELRWVVGAMRGGEAATGYSECSPEQALEDCRRKTLDVPIEHVK
jgi:Protein of unknown function (DUF550)